MKYKKKLLHKIWQQPYEYVLNEISLIELEKITND